MSWNGFRAALSLTFDDGLTCQLEHAVPALDAAGIRGTFFLATDCMQYPLDLPKWIAAHHTGHEIGSHSVTHRKAAELTEREALAEARGSKAYLQEVFAARVPSFCYPYTDAPKHLQDPVSRCYQQARGGRVAREDKFLVRGDGANLHNVPCYHVNAGVLEAYEHIEWLDEAVERRAWLTLMFHGVGPDASQWDNVPSPLFAALLNRLNHYRIKGLLWTDTFGRCAEAYRHGK